MGYLFPVNPTWVLSRDSHLARTPPSREPGTDLGCDIGTPVYAPHDFTVLSTSWDIMGDAGRFVRLGLSDGRGFRCLHLSEPLVEKGATGRRGDIIGLSGATGYRSLDWSNDGSGTRAHTHVTLFPEWGSYYSNTLDFQDYATDYPLAGGNRANIRRNPDMPVFIDGAKIVNWPNGYTNQYDANVWQVLKWVAEGAINESWAVEIYVSEAWKAARELDRILDPAIPTAPISEVHIDVADVAQKVAERLKVTAS